MATDQEKKKELQKSQDGMLEKIELIRNFISLSLRRDKIGDALLKVIDEVKQVQDAIKKAEDAMHHKLPSLLDEMDDIMRQVRRRTIKLQDFIFQEKKHKLRPTLKEPQINTLLNGENIPTTPAFSKNSQMLERERQTSNKASISKFRTIYQENTPRMTIAEYKASPFISRKISIIPLTFTEFDVEVTMEAFESVPKYMCGRLTRDELNNFLENVIVPCFNEKYQLLHRQRSALRSNSDIELWKLYNEQRSYLPGNHFITAGDVSRKLKKIIGKKENQLITILRHIGILREDHKKKTVCYIWTAQS